MNPDRPFLTRAALGAALSLLLFLLPAHAGKLLPVDEAGKDPSFKGFRDQLLTAVRKKDSAFLMGALDAKIQTSFGEDAGVRGFKAVWKPEQPHSRVWKVLEQILTMGGTFDTVEGQKEFYAPYVYTRFEQTGKDPFEYTCIVQKDVPLRRSAGEAAPVLERLSYEVVRRFHEAPVKAKGGGEDWVRVQAPSGKRGFVPASAVWGPTDERAGFRKINGTWKMTFLIAGGD